MLLVSGNLRAALADSVLIGGCIFLFYASLIAATNTFCMGSETRASELAPPVIPDSSPAGAIVLSSDGSIEALNDLAAKLLGRDRDALVGEKLSGVVAEASLPALEAHLEAASEAVGRPMRCEIQVNIGADQAHHVLMQTVASADAEAAYHAVVVDFTPFTERVRRAEKERAAAQDALADAEEAKAAAERVARSKTDFLARLSHEIRSALASMVGFADMLREDAPAANRELAEIISDSGRHLLDTLNSVMDLARLEFQKGEIELVEVDVARRVRDRSTMFKKFSSARAIDLIFRAESGEALARLNATFLDRIVHNLIDNAIKYTDKGTVEVTVEKREGQVWIYVADTGRGMKEDFLPRLFSPFEREKRATEAAPEGVGLGLAITKYLVELMDGQIVACSTKDAGSTFTVTFPAIES